MAGDLQQQPNQQPLKKHTHNFLCARKYASASSEQTAPNGGTQHYSRGVLQNTHTLTYTQSRAHTHTRSAHSHAHADELGRLHRRANACGASRRLRTELVVTEPPESRSWPGHRPGYDEPNVLLCASPRVVGVFLHRPRTRKRTEANNREREPERMSTAMVCVFRVIRFSASSSLSLSLARGRAYFLLFVFGRFLTSHTQNEHALLPDCGWMAHLVKVNRNAFCL